METNLSQHLQFHFNHIFLACTKSLGNALDCVWSLVIPPCCVPGHTGHIITVSWRARFINEWGSQWTPANIATQLHTYLTTAKLPLPSSRPILYFFSTSD